MGYNESNTGRIVARQILWIEEDGTIVHGEKVRRLPAAEAEGEGS